MKKIIVFTESWEKGVVSGIENKQAKKIFPLIKEKFYKAYLVDMNKARMPPEDFVPRKTKNIFWCPYDRKGFRFIIDEFGNRACPVCGISEKDFDVKSANGLWEIPTKSNRK